MEPTRIEMRCARKDIFGSRLGLETRYTRGQASTTSAVSLFCYSL